MAMKPADKPTTSQKHRDFVSEPMSEKSVKALPGIGDVRGGRLEDKGFEKAYVVLEWLKDICGANAKQSQDCYICLKEWCNAFL
ncbi:barrier-to-autointegration factor A-like [Leptodactylus fuscus]